MLKTLYFLAFDVIFIYTLIAYFGELRGYIFLVLAFIAFFTWELVRSIKQLFE